MSTDGKFKHVGLLFKKESQTYEEFLDHWLNVHAKLAEKVPGLRGYVINPIDRREFPDSPIDGFSELWFDSEADLISAFETTPEGIACIEDVPNFMERVAITNIKEVRVK